MSHCARPMVAANSAVAAPTTATIAIAAGAWVLPGLDVELDAAIREVTDEGRVGRDITLRCNCLEAGTVEPLELEDVLRLSDVANTPVLDVVKEIGECRVGPRRLTCRHEHKEGPDGENDDEHPRNHPEKAGAWQFASEHGVTPLAA